MNTEQTYSGEGDSTTFPGPTDATAANTPTAPYDWRDPFLDYLLKKPGAKEYLFLLLELLHEFNDASDPAEIISELFEVWVRAPHVELSAKRHELAMIMRHVAFLNKLRSRFTCFAVESDYIEIKQQDGHE